MPLISFQWMVVFSLLAGALPALAQTPTPLPWPQYQRDAAHTGSSHLTGPKDPVLRWTVHAGSQFAAFPIIGLGGRIHAGNFDGGLYTYSHDGRFLWSFPTGGAVDSSAATDPQGNIFFGSRDGSVYSVDFNGSLRWSTPLDGPVSNHVVLTPDGSLAVTTDGGEKKVSLLDSQGQVRWSFPTVELPASPAVDSSGILFFGTKAQHLFALNSDGNIVWSRGIGHEIAAAPSLDENGSVFFVTPEQPGFLFGLETILPGLRTWTFNTSEGIGAPPAIDSLGRTFVTSWNGSLYALDINGTLRWSFPTQGSISTAPVVDGGGTVYAGSADNFLYAVEPDGSLKWSYDTGFLFASSLAIGTEDTLVATSIAGTLFSLGQRPSPTPTDSPVPTATPTDSPSATPTQTPTASPTPTGTPTQSPTVPPSTTPTPTNTTTPSPSPTLSPTATRSPTRTPTQTPSPTSTATSSPTYPPHPPYTTQHFPPRGAVNVPSLTTVSFHVHDDEEGVDLNTVVISLNGEPAPYQTTEINGAKEYLVFYRPPFPFPSGTIIKVAIDASDLGRPPHTMPTDRYQFIIAKDTPTTSPSPTPTALRSPTPTPTPSPTRPLLLLAGYMDTRLTSNQGGSLTALALATGSGSAEVQEVEFWYGGLPTGVRLAFTANDGFFAVFQLSPVVLQAPLPAGKTLLSLRGYTGASQMTSPWPFLTVTP